MTEDSLFHKRLSQTEMRGNRPESAFPDLFAEDTACLSTGIELARYISSAHGNWDYYNADDNTIAGIEENNDEDIGGGPPDNPYKLYIIYN